MSKINIYRPDGSLRMAAHIGIGSKRYFTLMERDNIQLKFTVKDPVLLHTGDFISLPHIGRYELLAPYKPEREPSGGGYSYQPTFEAQYRKFSNRMMKLIPGVGASETSWTYTENIKGHAEQIMRNIAALSYSGDPKVVMTENGNALMLELDDEGLVLAEPSDGFLYEGRPWSLVIDNAKVSPKYITVNYSSTSILDAISDLAKQLECEWWFEENVLHFGKCEYGDEPLEISETLEYEYEGRTMHGNMCKSSRSDSKESNATRLYVYGSDRNIPSTYRKRLVFFAKCDEGIPKRYYDPARPLKGEFFPKSMRVYDMRGRVCRFSDYNNGGPEGAFIGGTDMTIYEETSDAANYDGSAAENLIMSGNYTLVLSSFKPRIMVDVHRGEVPSECKVQIEVLYRKSDKDNNWILATDTNNNPMAYSTSVKIENGNEVYPDFEDTPISFKDNVYGVRITVRYIMTIKDNTALEININQSGSNCFISTADANPIVGAVNLTLNVLDRQTGEVVRTISGVTLNPEFRKENPGLAMPRGISEDDSLKVDDLFEIVEINKPWVPSAYFSNKYTILDRYAHLTTNGIVTNRLLLPEDKAPGGYIDTADHEFEEEAIEGVVTFEEIYPQRTSYITEVGEDTNYEEQQEMSGEKTRKPYPVYNIRDDHFNENNPWNNDYKIPEKPLQIQFQGVVTYKDLINKGEITAEDIPEGKHEDSAVYEDGGKLTGLTFDVTWLSTNRWQIQRNDSIKLPNELLKPSIGDTYILFGFNVAMLSDENADYIGNAENLLWLKANEYKDELNTDASVYSCTMACDWAELNVGSDGLCFGLGQKVNLINPAYFLNGRVSRIIGWEVPLDIPYDNPVYLVGEKAKYSRFGEMQNSLDSLQFSAGSLGSGLISTSVDGGDVSYLIKERDTTKATDVNAYSALRTDKEIRERSLSKTSDDRTPYKLSTDKGFEVGNYEAGASGGIFRTDSNGESYIETDRLRVRKTASFEELEVSRVTSVAGKQIVTPGGGAVIASVNEIYNNGSLLGYKCYLTATDGDRKVTHNFAVGDLVYCQTFNLVGENGTSANRFYWRKCSEVGEDYIVLAANPVARGSVAPKESDTIVQLGHESDPHRQSAIIIDTVGDNNPSIKLYSGISTYSLSEKSAVDIGVNDGIPYINAYGDFFFGDKDESTYMRYDSSNRQLSVKAKIDVESTVGDRPLSSIASGDNTKTTIDGGIVTTGTILLEGGDGEVKAGISGSTTQSPGDIRFWAGSENKDNATFKVHQNGLMESASAVIQGSVTANSLILGEGTAITAVNDNKYITLPKLAGTSVRTLEVWIIGSGKVYFKAGVDDVYIGENIPFAGSGLASYAIKAPGMYRVSGMNIIHDDEDVTFWNIIKYDKPYYEGATLPSNGGFDISDTNGNMFNHLDDIKGGTAPIV